MLAVDIGGVTIGLELPSDSCVQSLRARYVAFETQSPPAWQLRLNVGLPLDQSERAWITHEGPLTRFRVAEYQGWIDFERKQAHVVAPSEALATSAVERVMGYICMQELPRHHMALLLHGVGVVAAERGYVFFGASGRGKSTVGRLASGVGETLSDELVIVRLHPAGATLQGTPFWSTGTPTERIRQVRYREVPLVALYGLHHARDFVRKRLSPGAAIMELLTSEKVATERVSSADAWLATAEQLVTQVPVYRLGFRPTFDLWYFLGITSEGIKNYDS